MATHPLGHSHSPGALVALARTLYHFGGDAFLCRSPGRLFAPGTSLSPEAEVAASQAALLIARLDAFASQTR